MEKEITVKDAITQDGGAMQIRHGETLIYAPTNHVHQALHLLKTKIKDREATMQSVNVSIAKLEPLCLAGTATQEQAMACAQDIAIWFANEVLEGRATLEQKNLEFVNPNVSMDG